MYKFRKTIIIALSSVLLLFCSTFIANAFLDETITATLDIKAVSTLTVSKTGAGTGSITSDNSHINCGTTCTYDEDYNAVVILTATPTPNTTDVFAGWSGAVCSNTSGTCTVTMDADKTVTAIFNKTIVAAPVPVLTIINTYGVSNGASTGVMSYGQNYTVSWGAVANATSCTLNTGTDNVVNGGTFSNVATSFTNNVKSFVLSCTGSGGTGTSTATISYPPAPTALVTSCNTIGTVGTVSWTKASGYTNSSVYIGDTDMGGEIYNNSSYGSNSLTFDTTPGAGYDVFVYTPYINSSNKLVISQSIYSNIVCANPSLNLRVSVLESPSSYFYGYNKVSADGKTFVVPYNDTYVLDWDAVPGCSTYKLGQEQTNGNILDATLVNGVTSTGYPGDPNPIILKATVVAGKKHIVSCSLGGLSITASTTIKVPPPPTSFKASCNSTTGAVGNLSWIAPTGSGYNTFSTGASDIANKPISSAIDNNVVGLSKSFTTTPGEVYDVWVKTIMGNGATSDKVSPLKDLLRTPPIDGKMHCPIPAPSGSLVATICEIAPGDSRCTASLAATLNNTTKESSITSNRPTYPTTFSNLPEPLSPTKSATYTNEFELYYGQNTLRLLHDNVVLNSLILNGYCGGGSYWVGDSVTGSCSTGTRPDLTVTTGDISNITSDGATGGGSITSNGGYSRLYYGIQWSLSADTIDMYSSTFNLAPDNLTTPPSYPWSESLSDMGGGIITPGTKYYYRSFVIGNDLSTDSDPYHYSYGTIKEFTTLPTIPTGYDFKPSAPVVTPPSVAGVSKDFNSTVKNQGSVSLISRLIGRTRTGILWNVFQVKDSSNNISTYHSSSILGLASGESKNTTYSHVFLSSGTYSVRFCTDMNVNLTGNITEANEANNCSDPWTTVVVTEPVTSGTLGVASGLDSDKTCLIPVGSSTCDFNTATNKLKYGTVKTSDYSYITSSQPSAGTHVGANIAANPTNVAVFGEVNYTAYYGKNYLYLFNNSKGQLAELVLNAECDSTSIWNGINKKCVAKGPEGYLNVASGLDSDRTCTIPVGKSTCDFNTATNKIMYYVSYTNTVSKITSDRPASNSTVVASIPINPISSITKTHTYFSYTANYGINNLYLYNNSVVEPLATLALRAKCPNTAPWDSVGKICKKEGTYGTLTSPSSCLIPLNGNSCNVTLNWSTTKTTSASEVTTVGNNSVVGSIPANSTSTPVSGTKIGVAAIFDDTNFTTGRFFYLYNNAVLIADPLSIKPSCASGVWNGSSCGGALTTGNLYADPSPCYIGEGSSSCDTSLSWYTTNPSGIVSSLDENGSTLVGGNNYDNLAETIYHNTPRVFSLINSGKTLSDVEINAYCSQQGTNLIWIGGKCEASIPPINCAENTKVNGVCPIINCNSNQIKVEGICQNCSSGEYPNYDKSACTTNPNINPDLNPDPNNTCTLPKHIIDGICKNCSSGYHYEYDEANSKNICVQNISCISPQIWVPSKNVCEAPISCIDPLVRDLYSNGCIDSSQCSPPNVVKGGVCKSQNFIYNEN